MKEKILILRSGKCAWSGCIFCGWGKYDYPRLSLIQLKNILDGSLRKVNYGELNTLKIFCSGSFLDKKQIPETFRSYVVKKCEQLGIKNLVIESRPEFIENIKNMKNDKVKVTVGIGLEVADNKILKKLNKGITTEDYEKAVKFLRKNGFGIRSYLLVNAPYTNKNTLKRSVEFAEKYSDSICLLNWFPHGRSKAFDLWLKKKYMPLDEKEFLDYIKPYRKNRKIDFDFYNFVFIPSFPKQEWIKGATKKELLHPYFEVWQDYVCRFYEKPKSKKAVLFIPCTYTKPYSRSRLHKNILKTVPRNIHLVVISSPGVVPYEFVNKYPFNKYDWPEWEETEEIKKLYVNATKKRIENYLKKHKYEKYYCYLKPSSESYQALKKACEKLNIKLINCLKEGTWKKIKEEKNSLALPDALEDLKKCH